MKLHGIDALARRPRRLYALVALMLLAWPPLHMLLVHQLGFSSWRLGGWGMYATPSPQTSDVVVVMRACDGTPTPGTRLDGGPHLLVVGPGNVRVRRLGRSDPEGYARARALAAFRQDYHYRDFDRWLRVTHSIPASTPLVLATIEPRLDLERGRALAVARARTLQGDEIVERATIISSAARLTRMLPPCEVPR